MNRRNSSSDAPLATVFLIRVTWLRVSFPNASWGAISRFFNDPLDHADFLLVGFRQFGLFFRVWQAFPPRHPSSVFYLFFFGCFFHVLYDFLLVHFDTRDRRASECVLADQHFVQHPVLVGYEVGVSNSDLFDFAGTALGRGRFGLFLDSRKSVDFPLCGFEFHRSFFYSCGEFVLGRSGLRFYFFACRR